MPSVKVINMQGAVVGDVSLSDKVFASPCNPALMHQVVRVQMLNRRQGTQSALTRSEVSGGGKKPWRQKGTGRARQGSTRSPQWRHGGVVFAPKPRSWRMTLPRKMKQAALFGALSDKLAEGKLIVLDRLLCEDGKTRSMKAALKAMGIEKTCVLVVGSVDEMAKRACQNIEGLTTVHVSALGALSVIGADKCILVKDALQKVEEVYAQ